MLEEGSNDDLLFRAGVFDGTARFHRAEHDLECEGKCLWLKLGS